ncbi:GF14 protein [Zostera marina]|uniref:GF14 protein n=1 Tax=Zostera marina TaxID=29655 RepID=A0A0K9PZQ2_ZOSMR|nr:GF14 protein [Zostera marina]
MICAKRASWKIVSSIEYKEESRGNENLLSLIRNYRVKIESDLTSICNSILNLLDTKLVPLATASEYKVFYYKMKGDYYRYLAEFRVGTERRTAAENALYAYKFAQDIAVDFHPTDPTRLGLTLNFSVFFFEILNAPERALSLARQAFDNALAKIDDLGEDYKDSTTTLELIKDNIAFWTYTAREEAEGSDEIKQ